MPLRLFLLLCLTMLVGCSVPAGTTALPSPTPVVYERVLPPGTIQVLDNPRTVGVVEANQHIGPQDIIMGIVMGSETRAYPIGLMRRYGIANDVLNNEPLAVTFCNACNTGLAFSRQIANRTLSFEVSGLLYNNALVMTDRETGSQWSQIMLQALEGELVSTRLELLASNQMTWQEWAQTYPDTTLVLDPRAPQRDQTAAFMPPALPTGDELDPDSMYGYVAGIVAAEGATAYAIEAIEREGLIQSDAIAQPPLLLVALEEKGAIKAWERIAGGQTLTFRRTGNQLIDQETGSVWDSQTGQALSGSLSGKQLTAVPVWITDWRGWFDLYPDTTLYQ
jgi:hypothetical protein